MVNVSIEDFKPFEYALVIPNFPLSIISALPSETKLLIG
jgi:hypothetical protein